MVTEGFTAEQRRSLRQWVPVFTCACGATVWARSQFADLMEVGWEIRHGEGEALTTRQGREIAEAHGRSALTDPHWIWPALIGDWIATVHEYESGPYSRSCRL